MTLHDNAYAAFMLDYAAGALAPAERLAADIHRVLSVEGYCTASVLETAGGALLEAMPCAPVTGGAQMAAGEAEVVRAGRAGLDARLAPFLEADLLALRWRRPVFGVQTLPAGTPMASLLRLDPGDHAPRHGHGRRDVTVVLRGCFADEYGVYERGDLAFAEPGLEHTPRAVGDEPCVCLLAREAGRPLRGFLGLFGWGGEAGCGETG